MGFLAIIASVFFVSAVGRWITEGGMDWYETLVIPELAPPGWVIGFAWSFIYICTATSALILYTRAKKSARLSLMLAFGANGMLNILWTAVFFGVHELGWAVVEIMALELSVIWIMVHAAHVSKRATLLLLPYAAWVLFAGYLTLRLWQLNG